MDKKRNWQFFLIGLVIILTIYNIAPTILYYSKPLKKPITKTQAHETTTQIAKRIDSLENESLQWIRSFCTLLNVSPKSLKIDSESPQWIHIQFSKNEEAKIFRKFFPKAGQLIAFHPMQLSLLESFDSEHSKNLILQRKIPFRLDSKNLDSWFTFSPKKDSKGIPTSFHRTLINDRASKIICHLENYNHGFSKKSLFQQPQQPANLDLVISLSEKICKYADLFGMQSPITKRFFSRLMQNHSFIKNLIGEFTYQRDHLKEQKAQLSKELENSEKINSLASLKRKETLILKAEKILKDLPTDFSQKTHDSNQQNIFQSLQKNENIHQTFTLLSSHPFFSHVEIDYLKDSIHIAFHDDFSAVLQSTKDTHIQQLFYEEIANLQRNTEEKASVLNQSIEIAMNHLVESTSLIALDLHKIAQAETTQVKKLIQNHWRPESVDFSKNFQVYDSNTYFNLPEEQKKFCFVIHHACLGEYSPFSQLDSSSVYVIAKGVDSLLKKYEGREKTELAQCIFKDFKKLQNLLSQSGYMGYPGSSQSQEFHSDFIFEKNEYYLSTLASTRENFKPIGSKKYAILELTDLEQRLLTQNKIETQTQEDLLKWKDDYLSAQVEIQQPEKKFLIPKPTKSTFWNNFFLSVRKYFRGDERKIIRWGQDLTGGKTVLIELQDENQKPVTSDEAIKQGINELYHRVNKLGVSEVTIRQEGSHIAIDFPGSQGLSAKELIKGSSMFFHIVNEKFSSLHPTHGIYVQQFLQEIWNEALVTNRKSPEDIQEIAWKHLNGTLSSSEKAQPKSEAARVLYEKGLRLAPIEQSSSNLNVDTSLSKIVMMRNSKKKPLQQDHSLMIVFQNHALEGACLSNIRSGYDPSKGNLLSFEVMSNHQDKNGSIINPQKSFYSWTSKFAKSMIQGTPLANDSQGRGWRMAVLLNHQVINAPMLDEALKNSAMITGNFTQREVHHLVADLKAGSLSYTPKILSEKNVSPELGVKDRTQGIIATLVALIAVVILMVAYYRFGGVVASIAVIFNLLIMWAVLQNLQATLTLAGIAGVILTVGMAVDANVLVFERIREELKEANNLQVALKTGYNKAFSAIFDSNITTIIAALILLNFDSGPIRGFAVTLIIGIASSMFTALFVTRVFFSYWVKRSNQNSLNMAQWIRPTKFNFLKWGKLSLILSISMILIGSISTLMQKDRIFGMDFTGGYSLQLELDPKIKNPKKTVEMAFQQSGASPQDYQIRNLSSENHLRIQFAQRMNLKGKPFYKLPEMIDVEGKYLYESNPRIQWIVSSLAQSGIQLDESTLTTLDENWSSMSGQMSDRMRNHALLGLGLAMLCILIYITFRFELKFALSAMLCLLHDVFFTIGLISLLYYFEVPVQIDMHAIAALMTIIGYSLNDTIIVFDRIREESKFIRDMSFPEVVNHSLNITLSRTTITSGTTLAVLIALVLLGGSTIFSFALIMAIGVIVGTFSSLFIASPLMLYFYKKEKRKSFSLRRVER